MDEQGNQGGTLMPRNFSYVAVSKPAEEGGFVVTFPATISPVDTPALSGNIAYHAPPQAV